MWKWMMMLSLVAGVVGCAHGPEPRTVERVDLGRYAGRWYEIARLPQGFEKGCAGVTATYTLREDGKVGVVNRCEQGRVGGKSRDISGVARVTNAPANTKLKVMFFWPFEGDYWVFRLNDDYTTAAVGSPDRKSLWILHRSPEMSEEEYGALVGSLKSDGFPVEKLERTPQK